MKDRLGRDIEYLRVSVTQNCNLKCIYCAPDENRVSSNCCSSLSPEEYKTIIMCMVNNGINRVRITGGEPLTRLDVCDIIKAVSKLPGIKDLSMTTNGIHLATMAKDLKKAGLMRLNISLDSLKGDKFKHITGGGRLEDVLKGIDEALKVGLTPIKINTVLIKGINDDEIDDFINLAKYDPIEVRFIELMPVGKFGDQNRDKIVYNTDIIASHPQLVLCEDNNENGPSQDYLMEGYKGKIGFISPMSHEFCGSCNRIRLTCDGKIKPCLGNNGEVDAIGILRNNPEKLEELVKRVIYEKPEGHNFSKKFESDRSMNLIGG